MAVRERRPSFRAASSTAPSWARIPQLMFIPSRAGPAAQDAAKSSPFRDRTISPFVPMSMNRTLSFASVRSAVTIPATMSPPTNEEICGRQRTRASGWMRVNPRSEARSYRARRSWGA